MTSAASDSRASRPGGNTWVRLAGMPVWAVPAMACTVAEFSATAAGAAITPASTAGPAIQHTTMSAAAAAASPGP